MMNLVRKEEDDSHPSTGKDIEGGNLVVHSCKAD